jgi:nicotinic acid mononucleotide adenylyltransferase
MKLFRKISFIVMPRAGYAGDIRETVKTYLHTCISEGYRFQDEPRSGAGYYIHSEMQPIYISSVCLPDISSTEIRRRIKAGQPVRQMMPEPVENFIKTKGLFNDI